MLSQIETWEKESLKLFAFFFFFFLGLKLFKFKLNKICQRLQSKNSILERYF